MRRRTSWQYWARRSMRRIRAIADVLTAIGALLGADVRTA
jgi:hypothetical protein